MRKGFSFPSLSNWLSLIVLFVGILVSYYAGGVMGLWVGSEIGFLAGINLMSGDSVLESEKVMQYFIVQVVGSVVWGLGCLMVVNCVFPLMVESVSCMGVCLKLGIFPFCFWVPGVMRGLSWCGCFLVSVVFKLMPFVFMFNMDCGKEVGWVMVFLSVFTVFYGSLGGLGLEEYKSLLAYSSLVHSGLMMLLGLGNSGYFFYYWWLYFVLVGGFMFSFWVLNVDCSLDWGKYRSSNFWLMSFLFIIYFASFVGVPPFTGFYLKLLFLFGCWGCFPVTTVICYVATLPSVYFYTKALIDISGWWSDSLVVGLMTESAGDLEKKFVVNLLFILGVLMNVFLGNMLSFGFCRVLF